MGQYQRTRLILVLFVILMIALGILVGAGKAMVYYKQSVSQKALVRCVESIADASMCIAEALSKEAKAAAEDEYDSFCELVASRDDSSYKESEIESYYRLGVVNAMKSAVGGEDNLYAYLSSLIPEVPYGKVSLTKDCKPYFDIVTNDSDQIVSATVKGVELRYDGVPGVTRVEKVRYDIEFPQVTFYAGNEDLLDYCIMASKGVYIQGATSSLVGDVFAGEHTATECRDMEVAYGEIASYGGINALSTQVGISANRIVSLADMNLSGSFVIISPPEKGDLKCYIRQLRKMRGYNSESMCSIEGATYDIRQLPDFELEEYLRISGMAETALSSLIDIPYYYDSDNDPYYEGGYRKIISSQDIEISGDVTGIVMTPGNVIVNVDSNVEGLILAGDRVYLQGNNNVVSNANVVKHILTDEIAETNGRNSFDEEVATDGRSDVYYHALDYIGGLSYPGIEYPEYFIVPYQE